MRQRAAIEARMKDFYESSSQTQLVRRMPVIIRIDGKNFKNVTRKFEEPFDANFREAMCNTALDLLDSVQCAVFAYTQSDEISLFLKDYEKLETAAPYDYNVQKLVSITASMATAYFNKRIGAYPGEVYQKVAGNCMFDSRVFNVPKEEVTNYFFWRQLDCRRNAIASVARYHLSKQKVKGMSCEEMKVQLMEQCGIDIEDINQKYLNGYYLCKRSSSRCITSAAAPIFKNEGRDVIESLID